MTLEQLTKGKTLQDRLQRLIDQRARFNHPKFGTAECISIKLYGDEVAVTKETYGVFRSMCIYNLDEQISILQEQFNAL